MTAEFDISAKEFTRLLRLATGNARGDPLFPAIGVEVTADGLVFRHTNAAQSSAVRLVANVLPVSEGSWATNESGRLRQVVEEVFPPEGMLHVGCDGKRIAVGGEGGNEVQFPTVPEEQVLRLPPDWYWGTPLGAAVLASPKSHGDTTGWDTWTDYIAATVPRSALLDLLARGRVMAQKFENTTYQLKFEPGLVTTVVQESQNQAEEAIRGQIPASIVGASHLMPLEVAFYHTTTEPLLSALKDTSAKEVTVLLRTNAKQVNFIAVEDGLHLTYSTGTRQVP
jgi:hypothetical protein